MYALATENNMSVKPNSCNGYAHGQLTVTENILCVYFNASVHAGGPL